MPPVEPWFEASLMVDEVVAELVGFTMLSMSGKPPVEPFPNISSKNPPVVDEAVDAVETGAVGDTMLSAGGMPPVDPYSNSSLVVDEVVAAELVG